MNRPARRRHARTPVWHYGELVQPCEVELPEQDLLLPDYREDEPCEWVDGFRARMAEIEGRRSA